MKKISLLISILLLTLSGCANSAQTDDNAYHIEIVKQLDHASLDEIQQAIITRLDEIASEQNIEFVINTSSGQNDPSILKQICDRAISSDTDAIIPIATLAAQIATSSVAGKNIPVIFAAISDPEAAELTGIDYLTGTSDALNTEFIIEMMLKQNPDIKKVGLLYSLSETNSTKPIAEAKSILESKNIEYIEAVGNTTDEILTSTSVLLSEKVDAVFTPTDNVVMATELAIAPLFIEANIPHYTGADSFVRNGAFATCGVNYTDLGRYTADLTYKVINEGFDNIEDYYLMDGGIITVNSETATSLNIDTSIFKDMGELVEVKTSEE